MRRIAVVLVIAGCAPAKPPVVVPEAALTSHGSGQGTGSDEAVITPGMVLTLRLAPKTATVIAKQPCPRHAEPVPSEYGSHRGSGRSAGSGAHPLRVATAVVDAAVNPAILGMAIVDGVRAPDPVQRTHGCFTPAVRLWVTLELPAGIVLRGRTNERGEVTFAIPASVPAGPAVARAMAIRSAVMMYEGADE